MYEWRETYIISVQNVVKQGENLHKKIKQEEGLVQKMLKWNIYNIPKVVKM